MQADRKKRHDLKAVDSSFQPGDRVLTRIPGLRSKLDGSWEGPFTVLEVPSPFHVVLGPPGQKGSRAQGKRVHINACKPFLVTSVHRVDVWALEDDTLEVVTRLKGNKLTADGEARLMALLDEWDSVLTDARMFCSTTLIRVMLLYSGLLPTKCQPSGEMRLRRNWSS